MIVPLNFTSLEALLSCHRLWQPIHRGVSVIAKLNIFDFIS